MILRHGSRESGIEFAVGCFLLALGCGLLIPRAGLGLYSVIRAGGHAPLWAATLVFGSLWMIVASQFHWAKLRLAAILFCILCWAALAFKFIDGQLWGATMQAVVAICLLNTCAFRMYRYLRGGDDGG